MGTAPPSKPLSEPARPFEQEQRRACLHNAFLPKARKDPSVLLHLISRREWQKVLIRVTLFPAEVTQRQKMTWYGVQWSLLPLHLACALQPPSEVIAMLLRFHVSTARVHMYRSSHSPHKKSHAWHRGRRKKKKLTADQNNYALYQSNQGSVPKIGMAPSFSSDGVEKHRDYNPAMPLNKTMETEETHKHHNSDSGLLLDDEAFEMEAERLSRMHVFESHEDTSNRKNEHSIVMPPKKLPDCEEAPTPSYAVDDHDDKTAESKVSLEDYLGKSGVSLQLSSTRSLEPTTIPSKMHWNLDLLLMAADAILPLHIACLYRASPVVISYLLEAYPNAVRNSAMGMLPIHMVCAGFELPAPVLAPPVPFPMDDEYDLAKSLRRLEKAFPESVNYPSANNGMTPRTYIDETVDVRSYKDAHLEKLGIMNNESIKAEDVAEAAEALVARTSAQESDHDAKTPTSR